MLAVTGGDKHFGVTDIAQNARMIATDTFFLRSICSPWTMKMGTMLKIQSEIQESAEYP